MSPSITGTHHRGLGLRAAAFAGGGVKDVCLRTLDSGIGRAPVLWLAVERRAVSGRSGGAPGASPVGVSVVPSRRRGVVEALDAGAGTPAEVDGRGRARTVVAGTAREPRRLRCARRRRAA